MKTLQQHIEEKLIINKDFKNVNDEEIVDIYNEYANAHYVYPYSKNGIAANLVNSLSETIINTVYGQLGIMSDPIHNAAKEFDKFNLLHKYYVRDLSNNGMGEALSKMADIKKFKQIFKDNNTVVTIQINKSIVILTAFDKNLTDGVLFVGINKEDLHWSKK